MPLPSETVDGPLIQSSKGRHRVSTHGPQWRENHHSSFSAVAPCEKNSSESVYEIGFVLEGPKKKVGLLSISVFKPTKGGKPSK